MFFFLFFFQKKTSSDDEFKGSDMEDEIPASVLARARGGGRAKAPVKYDFGESDESDFDWKLNGIQDCDFKSAWWFAFSVSRLRKTVDHFVYLTYNTHWENSADDRLMIF